MTNHDSAPNHMVYLPRVTPDGDTTRSEQRGSTPLPCMGGDLPPETTMEKADAEFDLTVREILVRNRETDEEEIAWNVESPNMERPCRADTPAEALRVLADCLEKDADERTAVSVEQLAEDNENTHEAF